MNYNHTQSTDKSSVLQIMSDIGILLLRLLFQLITRTARLTVKILQQIGKLMVILTQKAIEFWNSTGTIEKRKKIAALSKSSVINLGYFLLWILKALWAFMVWAAIQLWRGCIWTAKAIAELITHMKPTLHKAGTGIRIFVLDRQRAYHEFSLNGGFKGMLTKTRKKLHSQLDYYMNEDEENSEFVITNLIKEDDNPALGDAEFISESIGKDNKPRAIINNIYNELKKLVANE